MSNHANHSILWCDLGYFPEWAALCAPHFKQTFYWSPGAASPCPKENATLIGTGLPGVERVNHISEVLLKEPKDKLLIVFPDCGMGPDQVHLRQQGYRVWGAGRADDLELDRVYAKKRLKEMGFAIGPYKVVRGMDALEEYLKAHPKQWVKPNGSRGSFETFFVESLKLSHNRLQKIRIDLGNKAATTTFLVEEPIEPAVELCYDAYSVDGKYPKEAVTGIESKSKGWVGHAVPYAALPEPVRETNARIAPELARYKCRSSFGMEMRVTKKDRVPYILDPLARFGSPPNEALQVMIENWSDIFWQGAEGQVIDPVWSKDGRWGAELVIQSSSDDVKDWQVVDFPKALRPYVKLKNLAVIGGEYCIVPQGERLGAIGAVVAVGKTREEAIKTVRERAKQIKGDYIETIGGCLDEIEKDITELRSYGYSL